MIDAIHRLVDAEAAGASSLEQAADAVRRMSRAEATSLARSVGPERLALAKGVASALGGGPYEKVVEAIRAIVSSRPTAADLARHAAAAARCHRALERLVGASAALSSVRRAVFLASFGRSLTQARRIARVARDHDVLVTGETGTGKEQVANALLEASVGGANGQSAPRADLNVAAIPDSLLESELFGHRKGAFTGAVADRRGAVRVADGGCLFLDEVGDLPSFAQAKLLRVIETDRVQPVGSDVAHQVDVRFVSATHRDLPALVREGRFREDLYQRLAGTVIHLPPLRDRPEDLVTIGEHFLDQVAREGQLEDEIRAARAFLRSPLARAHAFPGNARELKNVLRNLVLGLPAGIGDRQAESGLALDSGVPLSVVEGTMTLAGLEGWYLERTLEKTGGNLAAAARILGVDRTTITRRRRQALAVESPPRGRRRRRA